MSKDFEGMVDMIREAYIEAMGAEKWASLTEAQKHDVIMIIAKDALGALA